MLILDRMSPAMINKSFQPIFSCSCGAPLPTIRPLSDWAQIIAFPCAHWVADSAAEIAARVDHGYTGNLTEVRLEQLPEVGSSQFLMVDHHFGMPVSGDSVWVLFKPSYSTMNDWNVAVPKELAESGLVCVEVIEILSRYEQNAWLRVRVLEVLRINELIGKWLPLDFAAPLPDLLNCGEITCSLFGNIAYCTASADDCFQSVVCQQLEGRWSLLMYSDWQYHSDYLEVGRRELSAAESLRLKLPGAA